MPRTNALMAPYLLLASLSACTTTGDPNQGGLFGWREDQARTRQHNLQKAIEQAQNDAEASYDRYRELQQMEAAGQDRVDALQALVNQLARQNRNLQDALLAATTQRQLAQAQLDQLEQMLQDYALASDLNIAELSPHQQTELANRLVTQNQHMHRFLLELSSSAP